MAGEVLNHRLIMFVGTPGAGKSTLSRWLWQQLADRSIPATLIPEEEVYPLEALQAFASVATRADPRDIGLLLDAVRSLCMEWKASGMTWITDQFLPAFHWLHEAYAPEHAQPYAEALVPILAPLHPLLVSLEPDVHRAWHRAVAERGQSWSDWMVDVFAQRSLLLHPDRPIRDLDGLLQLLVRGQRQSRALIARWPVETVMLDTDRIPLDQVKETLLRRLELSDVPHSSGEAHGVEQHTSRQPRRVPAG